VTLGEQRNGHRSLEETNVTEDGGIFTYRL